MNEFHEAVLKAFGLDVDNNYTKITVVIEPGKMPVLFTEKYAQDFGPLTKAFSEIKEETWEIKNAE